MSKIFFAKMPKIAGLLLISLLLVGQPVKAATPMVTATLVGGDSVSLTVTGDANSSVILNYLSSSNQTTMNALGNTNSSGQLTVTIGTAVFGIKPASLYYVTINNQRSDTQIWPYTVTNSTTGTALSLSQTTLTLLAGQSNTITAYNNNASSLYLGSNSNPAVANVSINNNQFTVVANASGSTTITVCSLANSSNCSSVTVTVQSSNIQPITFSQNNVTVGYGQNLTITLAGGTGTYTVSNNSNQSAMQATISGASLNLQALTSSGAAAITVCASDMSSCGVVNATAAVTGNSSTLTFSQANPTIVVAQNAVVTISGGSGTYYISANSNSGIVQANLVGSTLTLFGNSVGASLITVCVSGSGCGTLPVNVVSQGSSAISLNPSSLTVTAGQSGNVIISGYGNYSISSNSNSAVASAVISGSNVVVSGLSSGSTSLNICQTGGQCAILYVAVTGTITSQTAGAPTYSLVLATGQSLKLLLSGGQTPYSLSGNVGTIFSSVLDGSNNLTLTGVSVGTGAVSVCSASGSCAAINVSVSGSVAPTNTNNTSVDSTTSNVSQPTYKFVDFLTTGSKGAAVTKLQQRLKDDGFYSGPVNGNFGSLTSAAVKKFQIAHGVKAVGYVGPSTRDALNK